MNMLPMTTHKHQATLDVDIPLHSFTESPSDVARLVGTLLNEISEADGRICHGDILQALAITTAVRMAMADAASISGADFSMDVLDVEVGPGYEVTTYNA